MIKDYQTMEIARENSVGKKVYPWWRIADHFVRECVAEAVGTFILTGFINGVIAQVILGEGQKGDYTHISIGCGLAVMFGIHASGGVSGAHLNPAVTIALAVFGRFPWKKVPLYCLSQVIGGFFGAALVFTAYHPVINLVADSSKTAGIFATYPLHPEFQFNAFIVELIGTALLVFGIFSVDDPTNMPTNPVMKPLTVGLIIVMIGISFGMPTGYALNPARDLGPRLFTAIAGWGSTVFVRDQYYFWVPIFGPIIGAIVGGAVYIGLISSHHDHIDDMRANFAPLTIDNIALAPINANIGAAAS